MINGIINVYKEKGYTSFDVVAKLRKNLHQKKVGHTGTLDPDAEGVLPICFGRGTKLCDMLTDKSKVYETVMLLGKSTDTQDVSGDVLKVAEVPAYTEEELKIVVQEFTGQIFQVPPMYSALKVNGQKLCDLARAGKTVERKPRRIEIYSIEILSVSLPEIAMRIHCSKGTYIRTLCNDIGERLGCHACMKELKRVRVGRFSLNDAFKVDEIIALYEQGRIDEVVTPTDGMFLQYPSCHVKHYYAKYAYNGNPLVKKAVTAERELADGENVRMYLDGEFLAIYQYQEQMKQYKIVKMFYANEDND